ncbi:MAG: DUF5615 family PIN-like protein [Rhodoferax sp.]|nr:DUF5615 family PIN-like protein [Rhodoferax sp.]
MKLLLDQGLPRTAANLLRERGWDAQHVSECGMSRAEDVAIIAHARQEDRMVVTLDADRARKTEGNVCPENPAAILLHQPGLNPVAPTASR